MFVFNLLVVFYFFGFFSVRDVMSVLWSYFFISQFLFLARTKKRVSFRSKHLISFFSLLYNDKIIYHLRESPSLFPLFVEIYIPMEPNIIYRRHKDRNSNWLKRTYHLQNMQLHWLETAHSQLPIPSGRTLNTKNPFSNPKSGKLEARVYDIRRKALIPGCNEQAGSKAF